MEYARLFDLRITHDYHPDGRCPDLDVVPSARRLVYRPQSDRTREAFEPPVWQPAADRELARHRLVAKPRADGIDVLVPLADGQPFVPLGGLTLSFSLHVRDPQFFLFTAPPAQFTVADEPWKSFRASRPVFTNAYAPTDRSDVVLEPHRGDHVVPADVLAFAEVTGIESTWTVTPRHFTIAFSALQRHWAYYVLTKEGKKPRLFDTSGAIQFEQAQPLDGLVRIDDIAKQLHARYPAHTGHRVLSAAAVACRRVPTAKLVLELHEGGPPPTAPDAGLATGPWLTTPSIRDYTDRDDQAAPSLYHVIIGP